MKNVLRALGIMPEAKTPKTIYLVRMGGVGDLVLLAPTIKALKKKFPDTKITLGTGKGIFEEIVKNDPNIDEIDTSFFEWPPTRSFKKVFTNKKNLFQKKLKFEMVRSFNDLFFKRINGEHVIDRFAEYCGVRLTDKRPLVYLNDEDKREAKEIIYSSGITEDEPFIVLGPEVRSKGDLKNWPRKNFISLINRILENFNIKILTCLDPASTTHFPGTIEIRQRKTIRTLAAIIKEASLYIGTDNGLTHLAASFDTNIVSIHIGYSKHFSGALSPNAVIISDEPFIVPDLIKKKDMVLERPAPISVDRVYKEVESLLSNRVINGKS